MKVDIIRVGNSRGIRIPKKVLDELGFAEAAELEIADGGLTLRPVADPHAGWAEAFQSDPPRGDDADWPDTVSAEADEVWTW